jgi:PII-like signaling protein
MTGTMCKTLQIFIEDTDIWEGERLSEAIVHLLHKRGIAGATVWNGVMGYGAAGRIHRKGLFGVTDEKPVIITAIDSEKNLRNILPDILPMVKEGVVALLDTEVFSAAVPDT